MPVQDLPRDYRRTLYWNPNVTLDENGRAEIEFFNNSTCRHLSICAEGLSHDGKPLETVPDAVRLLVKGDVSGAQNRFNR